jgi:hypothetical protein
MLRQVFSRISLRPSWISFEVDRAAVMTLLLGQAALPSEQAAESPISIDIPLTLRRRGVETKMVLTDGSSPSRQPDPALIDLVQRAHRYLHQLTDGSGPSLTQIAAVNRTDLSEVSRLLPLAFLSPKIVELIFTSHQPVQLSAQRLSRLPELPYSWSEQSEILGC